VTKIAPVYFADNTLVVDFFIFALLPFWNSGFGSISTGKNKSKNPQPRRCYQYYLKQLLHSALSDSVAVEANKCTLQKWVTELGILLRIA
jgi:hypothetical protein